MNNSKVLLFIAWDGSGTHYMQGLFLPILNGLLQHEYRVKVLHLSSNESKSVLQLKRNSEELNIEYKHIPIKRSVLGFLTALKAGKHAIGRFQTEFPTGIIMPRSFMPGLLLRIVGLKKNALIYDADGLALEERLDFAGWRKSSIRYFFFKQIEKWCLFHSKCVLSRSNQAIEFLQEQYPFLQDKPLFKVVNGRNPKLFQPLSRDNRLQVRQELGVNKDELLVTYCGTIAPQYCLSEMLNWFEFLLQKKDAKLLILTGQQEVIKLHPKFFSLQKHVILMRVNPSDVPRYLGSSDLGLAFRKPSLSMKGVSPIKIAEYLFCGLPVIASQGIGDSEIELSNLKSSQLINESDLDQLKQSVNVFLESRNDGISAPLKESVELAREIFSLEKSIKSYLIALSCLKE